MKALMTVGLPGCGKSYFAQNSLQGQGFTEVNLDQIREELYGDASEQGDPLEVVGVRNSIVESLAIDGADIILSDTNINPEFRRQLLDRLKELGYETHIIYFPPDYELCQQRNQARERVVPDYAMEAMLKTLTEQPPEADEADAFYVAVPKTGPTECLKL